MAVSQPGGQPASSHGERVVHCLFGSKQSGKEWLKPQRVTTYAYSFHLKGLWGLREYNTLLGIKYVRPGMREEKQNRKSHVGRQRSSKNARHAALQFLVLSTSAPVCDCNHSSSQHPPASPNDAPCFLGGAGRLGV